MHLLILDASILLCDEGVCRTELGRYYFDYGPIPDQLNPVASVVLAPFGTLI